LNLRDALILQQWRIAAATGSIGDEGAYVYEPKTQRVYGATIWTKARIASPEMLPNHDRCLV
jgi:hypothetical protein